MSQSLKSPAGSPAGSSSPAPAVQPPASFVTRCVGASGDGCVDRGGRDLHFLLHRGAGVPVAGVVVDDPVCVVDDRDRRRSVSVC